MSSCLNQYEKKVIGNYEIYKYDLINPEIETYEYTKLNIKKDKTFIIKFENKVENGKWNANDNGDCMYIELELNNQKAEGRILGNSILFEGQRLKVFNNFKSIEFIKTE